MKLIDSKTFSNLAKAYASETMAETRYRFIEYGARNEGYNALSEIIDTVAYNEFNHARMLYTYIQKASKKQIDNIDVQGGFPFKEKWNLTENLRLAASDESDEAKVYKSFERTAREEGFEDVANLFKMIGEVEISHQKLFEDLYKQMNEGTLYQKEKPVKWVCTGCGYESTSNEAWDTCPLCKAKQGFVQVKLSNN